MPNARADHEARPLKDFWDKLDILLKPVGAVVAAAIAVFVSTKAGRILEDSRRDAERSSMAMQDREAKVRLYAELMSRREQAESDLRKDMFTLGIDSFLKPRSATLDARLANLELLVSNFDETFDFRPLLYYMQREIGRYSDGKRGEKYLHRLITLADEVRNKQLNTLTRVGKHFDIDLDRSAFEKLRKHGGTDIEFDENLELDGLKWKFVVFVQGGDASTGELLVQVNVATPPESQELRSLDAVWVSPFDFPLRDNFPLPQGSQRCAIVLMNQTHENASVRIVIFPGRAALMERPDYQEVFDRLNLRPSDGGPDRE